MQIIFYLFIIICGIIVYAVLLGLLITIRLVSSSAEYWFAYFDQGADAAKAYSEKRRKDREDSLENRMIRGVPWKTAVLIPGIVVLFITLCIFTTIAAIQKQNKRIEQTEQQIAKIADELIEQFNGDDAELPADGSLLEVDAWKQPLELQVDEQLLGTKITVRSSGADRELGTIDDLRATRMAKASAKEVGGELLERGVKSIKRRLSDFLEKDEVENTPTSE